MLEIFLVNLIYETERVAHRKQLEEAIRHKLATVRDIRPWLEFPSAEDFQTLFTNGCWHEARELARQYLRTLPPHPPLAEQGRAMSILATIARQQGRLDEAKQWIARLFPYGPSSLPNTPLFFVHERAQRVAIEVALEEGDLESAARWLDVHEAWLDGISCLIGRPGDADLLQASPAAAARKHRRGAGAGGYRLRQSE
ncbi:MAG: hypothetical protein R3A46_10460 [Thermomicrobiales bacterium]